VSSSAPPLFKILVVDDYDDARELYTELFLVQGFEVHAAGDGRSAIELAKSVRPDAILLDVALPLADGFSVLREVRGDAALASVRVVMLSATADPGYQARALELGADLALLKPCLPEVIAGAVLALLQERKGQSA
jgi:two-component system cell cycle response regulator DivK